MKEPLVIYIIGDNRSGTTLLDYLLSCHPEVYSVGELHNLSGFYHKTSAKSYHNWACSCGEAVTDCDFWNSIITRIGFKHQFQTKVSHVGSKLGYLSPSILEKIIDKEIEDPTLRQKGKEVAENCWSIYREVSERTGKPIIIDSSKNAIQAYFLAKNGGENIRFLLLERDIGAVAYSKLNRIKKIKPKQAKSIYTYILTSYKAKWENRILANRIENEMGAKIKKIDYLDLAHNPEAVIKEIISSMQMSYFSVPTHTNENKGAFHTIGGSPSRYEKKKIEPDLRYLSYYKRRPIAYFLKKLFANYN